MKNNVKKMIELIDEKIEFEVNFYSRGEVHGRLMKEDEIKEAEQYLRGLRDARDLLLNNSIL